METQLKGCCSRYNKRIFFVLFPVSFCNSLQVQSEDSPRHENFSLTQMSKNIKLFLLPTHHPIAPRCYSHHHLGGLTPANNQTPTQLLTQSPSFVGSLPWYYALRNLGSLLLRVAFLLCSCLSLQWGLVSRGPLRSAERIQQSRSAACLLPCIGHLTRTCSLSSPTGQR